MATPVVRSQVVSIGELLRSGVFAPARVQRAYCWTEEQQQALLEDLLAAFAEFGLDPEPTAEAQAPAEPVKDVPGEQPITLAETDRELELSAPFAFLGTLVLLPNEKGLEIYDGLQRITTLTILFAVLRDLMDTRRENGIEALLRTDAGVNRLALSATNDILAIDVLPPGRTAKRYKLGPGLTDAAMRVRECVQTLRGRLSGWNEARLAAFNSFVRDQALVSVIHISDRRISGKAFVSINSGGMPLMPDEILKGQLIDLASSVRNTDKAAERIEWVWNMLQEEFGKAGFDDFLRSVDFIERRQPQSADYALQLMEHIRRRYTGEEGVAWASDRLIQYRAAFKWVYEGDAMDIATGVHASLRRLQLLKWDQWRAFAMLIAIKSRPQDVAKRIDVLDRCCFALTLCTPDARRCAEMLGRKVERFAKGSFGKQGGFVFSKAQHSRMLRALESPLPDSGRRGTVMRWIEAAAHGDRVPSYVTDPMSSVEHVYPKNPETKWTAFEAGIDVDHAATIRELTGNLCVLPADELGNASFEEKRKAYQRLKGCRFANEISSARNWTPEQVRARTQRISEMTMRFLSLEAPVEDVPATRAK
jgi:hypothetical protein